MLPQEKRQKGNESPRRHKTNTAEFGADAVKAGGLVGAVGFPLFGKAPEGLRPAKKKNAKGQYQNACDNGPDSLRLHRAFPLK
ncbi:hypothetical protein CLOLEP_03732 [[Clostridium] leptum DSM 753]|uniref:Uncharacterized protein n=1 Tax=[Clostridium] leptum DSM 753 TaxID=428125 RepID=A7VYQ4_9FIRM|nr:hypothetical protein CLOLEP_03732 [[Clostridium] leptum DSM 753]